MTNATDSKREDRGGGVQTVETVVNVLNAFIGAESMPMLKIIAERADMHPAKVHRYLASFSKTGYARQDPLSGRYRLGPAALRLAYAAMDAVPVVPIARPVLKELSEVHRCSAFLALWSDAGPRIVLQEKESSPIMIAAHVGSILPLLSSSAGRTFAAWLPRTVIARLLRHELARLEKSPLPDCPTNLAEAEVLFDDIRRRRLARITGPLSAAAKGLSAPVFDAEGHICAVITMLSQAENFDTNWSGQISAALGKATADICSALQPSTNEYAPRALGRKS
ncbi:IclR family transcriptional regulator [Paraburkholderia oxyphila]|uniref:IclR family transcriptional regulator n=1 Tax=Paraburkholderia oxyphila TaxID=614212 RepID=UPI001428D7C0|nr:IclR family transcriptional regulator [Paraburkholderia oxyphila]